MNNQTQTATAERIPENQLRQASPINLIRGVLNQTQLEKWMSQSFLEDTDHAVHCLLKESFGETSPKPYRTMSHTGEVYSILYGYSEQTAEELRETALYSQDPAQAKILPPENLESKAMPTEWREGQRLSFETRTRMSLNTSSSLERATGEMRQLMDDGVVHPRSEYDLMVWENHLAKLRGTRVPPQEEVYAQWLSQAVRRSEAAVLENDRARLVASRSSVAKRKRDGKGFRGTDAVMRGNLVITNPDNFNTLMARGLGRHRSYGYGMLLLGPPARG